MIEIQNEIWNRLTEEQKIHLYFLGVDSFVNCVMRLLCVDVVYESNEYLLLKKKADELISGVVTIVKSMSIERLTEYINRDRNQARKVDCDQIVMIAKYVWSQLSEEQKETWYVSGTITLFEVIFLMLGYDTDRDLSYEEYERCIMTDLENED